MDIGYESPKYWVEVDGLGKLGLNTDLDNFEVEGKFEYGGVRHLPTGHATARLVDQKDFFLTINSPHVTHQFAVLTAPTSCK